MFESRRHLHAFLDSRFGSHSGFDADWCSRCWRVACPAEGDEIWLFDEESPDCEFTLLSRKEGEDGFVTEELASGKLREIRDWAVSSIRRGQIESL
ncbi:MAG: hypothetical protein AAB214_00440 [Fibrobacterota bacterium]